MAFDANPLVDRLCEAFPECFNRLAPKPLKIKIDKELWPWVKRDAMLAGLPYDDFRRAMKTYIKDAPYQQALVAGGPRYDLTGQPTGVVKPAHQEYAWNPPPAKEKKKKSSFSTEPALPPIDRTALLQEIMAMAIPGKLEVTIKISQLPEAKPASAQTMLFAVQADGKTVVVEVKNKVWNTLKTAAENYPQWVAAITGKMGQGVTGGFRLDGPAVQVFEKKPKPEAAATVPATITATTATVEPKAPETIVVESPTANIGRVKLTLKARATP
jgi:hypothetical protein